MTSTKTSDTNAIHTTHGEPPDTPEINEAGLRELDRREAEASAQQGNEPAPHEPQSNQPAPNQPQSNEPVAEAPAEHAPKSKHSS